MTTIAITATDVAYDSFQTINGNERSLSPIEKVRIVNNGKKIFCFAGDSDNEPVLERWINAGGKDKDLPKMEKANYYLVVISYVTERGTRKRRLDFRLYSDEQVAGVSITPPYCMGSGGAFAKGAIAYGTIVKKPASALDAVKAAALVDVFTGGEIKTLNIRKALARPRKETA